jgi:hypothetical protein
MNWIVAGVIAGLIAHVVDFIMWTFVFNKGMNEYTSTPMTTAPSMGSMMPQIVKSLFINLFMGIVFVNVYIHLRTEPVVHGIFGGAEFGVVLWLPTVFTQNVLSGIWFDKPRRLMMASAIVMLVKLVCLGLFASFVL